MDSDQYQDTPIINQPQYHRTEICIWRDLSLIDIENLLTIESVDEYYNELSKIFNLKNDNKKDAILLDFYYYTLKFARDNCFSKPQTSAFFSIMLLTHCVCIETPYWNFCQCFEYFKDMVGTHSVRRPPFSIDLFSIDEAKMILEYAINTYFRNFKLYKYVFTHKISLDLQFCYNGMPPSPEPPLETIETIDDPNLQQDQSDQVVEEAIVKDFTDDCASELKKLVRQHLISEMNKLTNTFDKQIKLTAEEIKQKLHKESSKETIASNEKKEKKK